jgi:hypothetical protein
MSNIDGLTNAASQSHNTIGKSISAFSKGWTRIAPEDVPGSHGLIPRGGG